MTEIRAFRLVALAALIAVMAPLSATTARQTAAERYERAKLLLADLRAVPKLELGPKQYELVISQFRSVHQASPASAYVDDALLKAADVTAEMATRFGPDKYRERAIAAYEFLIEQYPHSPLLGRARESLRVLKAGGTPPPRREPEPEAPPEPRLTRAAQPAVVTPVKLTAPPPAGPAPLQNFENSAQPSPARTKSSTALISEVRYWTHPDYTRIVVELDDYAPYKFEFLPRPSRLYFDLMTARLSGGLIRGATYEVPNDPAISKIRVGQNRRTMARIVFDLADEVAYNVSWLSGPPRLVIELRSKSATPVRFAKADPPKPAIPRAELPASARPAPPAAQPLSAPAVEPLAARVETSSKSFQEAFRELTTGGRVVEEPLERAAPQAPVVQARFEQSKAAPVAPAVIDAAPPKEASANSSGQQTLIRALGLKIGRIVIDAGHGGHDPGNIGPSGVQEKRIVLDISKRLGKLVEDRLGAEVVHTRVSDGFIDLTKRTQIANQAAADLFVSVHANSARQKNVRGVETFYLNLTSDPYALQVAARENAAANRSVHELQDLLGKIALKERIDESREFANKMQSALYGGLATTTKGLRNRGVRQAPFLVLIGAKMPAILAEVGFMSNATDEKLLNTPAYRQKVAEFIYQGIAAYVDTLSAHELTMTDEPTASAALD